MSGSTATTLATPPKRRLSWARGVFGWWALLAVAAAGATPTLDVAWPHWRPAFWAGAIWGLNVLVLVYGIGPPFSLSRVPLVSSGFALLMTLFGSGSYWATVQLYPAYEVGIERAALFVAACTAISLGTCALGLRHVAPSHPGQGQFVWDWRRVQGVTLLVVLVAAAGATVTLHRIGYVPVLQGDPSSLRIEFPAIGGIWYRLSMLGGVGALLAGCQVVAGRYLLQSLVLGLVGLACVGVYGPRFFVALPVGVVVLMWDRLRSRIPWSRIAVAALAAIPALALLFFWRAGSGSVLALGVGALILYGTLAEFRDLGWALDHYGTTIPLLHGATMASAVVPFFPRIVWSIVGVHKDVVFAANSANILADQMGRPTGQRIGLYGELFINFGWSGAVLGAVLYGLLLACLERWLQSIEHADWTSGVFVALAVAITIFAQIGQLNMFSSALVAYGYPLLAVFLVSARRAPQVG